MSNVRGEPSLGELLASLARDSGTLVRQEMQLASSEMTAKARVAARNAGVIGAGGALVHAGLLTLIAALVCGVASWVPVWLSALLIGLLIMGVGYGLVRSGLSALEHVNPMPEQTVQTLKDGSAWAKEQLNEQHR